MNGFEPMMDTMKLHAVGPAAVLVELPEGAGPAGAAALATWARGRVAAVEIVPAARTVLLDGVDPVEVRGVLDGWSPAEHAAEGPLVELPVTYDGPDLDRVAAIWDADPAEVLGALTFTSAFCGFAPGFAYLAGLPAARRLPRLDAPRPRVPVGSVAVAGDYAGVYPTASPGGWNLLGTTPATLWDPGAERPALLAPGTRVRFVRC